MKYRKKPVVVEAFRIGHQEPPDWYVNSDAYATWDVDQQPHEFIPTLEGDMEVKVGDWVIKGVKGELYPCKHDIFEMTYEAVNE